MQPVAIQELGHHSESEFVLPGALAYQQCDCHLPKIANTTAVILKISISYTANLKVLSPLVI